MIVGKLLVGYGELEFGVTNCLSGCLEEEDVAIQLMFRVRSGTARLDIADALLRPYFEGCNLLDEYEEAWLALQNCKAIRNRYAHSHSSHTEDGLFYTDFEKPAFERLGEMEVTIRHIRQHSQDTTGIF